MSDDTSHAGTIMSYIEYSRMPKPLLKAFWANFLGDSKDWFKISIIFFIFLNTVIRFAAGKEPAAVALLVEFIYCLVMSLQCYPLQSGGLLVVHAVAIGLTDTKHVLEEIEINLNVFLLLIFMVSCIHFLKSVLLFIFTQLLLRVEGKRTLAIIFLLTAALMSAFLDALTVSAVVVSVCQGLLGVYYHVVKHRNLPRINYDRRKVEYNVRPKIRRKVTKEKLSPEQVEKMLDDGVDPREHDMRGSREESFITDFEEFMGERSGSQTRQSLTRRPGEEKGETLRRSVQKQSTSGSGGPLDNFKMPKLVKVMSDKIEQPKIDAEGEDLTEEHKALDYQMGRFRAFLRSLLMHAAVGTALGGLVTKVGEPQNLIVADVVGWDFITFIEKMLPIWAPCIPIGIVITYLVETYPHCGYGTRMPDGCREILKTFSASEYGKMETREFANLSIQVVGSVLLVLGLVFQVAEVGLVGLMVIIIITSFNGIIVEHEIAEAFEDAMPFVSLIVVFFGVVAVLNDQGVFTPVIDAVLALDDDVQLPVLFLANGALSMVSDNVFVATIFIDQIDQAVEAVNSTISREQYDRLAISVLSGTNIPSMATPNGQAAFLFILTSNLAPIVGLSYRKMTLMALPYTLCLSVSGILAVAFFV